MKKIILFMIIILAFINQNILSQNSPVIVKIENKKSIARFDLTTRSQNIIYSTTKFIKDLTVSPNEKFLAFIEMTEGTFSSHEYKELPHNTLQILDTNTEKTLHSIPDDVRVHVWNSRRR